MSVCTRTEVVYSMSCHSTEGKRLCIENAFKVEHVISEGKRIYIRVESSTSQSQSTQLSESNTKINKRWYLFFFVKHKIET